MKLSGYHPWFVHWISVDIDISKENHYRTLFLDSSAPQKTIEASNKLLPFLPEPMALSTILAELRENLSAFPEAMLGEVGLDRICRIPYSVPAPPPYTLHDELRELSPLTVPLSHQLAVLEAQLQLAVELRRNVSLHSVRSQEATIKLFDKMKDRYQQRWLDISIDLHSCGVSVPTLKSIQVSFSDLLTVRHDSTSTVIHIIAKASERVHVSVNSDKFAILLSQGTDRCMPRRSYPSRVRL